MINHVGYFETLKQKEQNTRNEEIMGALKNIKELEKKRQC